MKLRNATAETTQLLESLSVDAGHSVRPSDIAVAVCCQCHLPSDSSRGRVELECGRRIVQWRNFRSSSNQHQIPATSTSHKHQPRWPIVRSLQYRKHSKRYDTPLHHRFCHFVNKDMGTDVFNNIPPSIARIYTTGSKVRLLHCTRRQLFGGL